MVDWDLFKLAEDQRSLVVALLEDLPDYCCLVLVYDQVEYKPNRSYKKLCSALEKNVQAVSFEEQSPGGDSQVGVPPVQGPGPHLDTPRRSTCSSPAAA